LFGRFKKKPAIDQESAWETLRGVSAPGLERDPVSLGFVTSVSVEHGAAVVSLTVSAAAARQLDSLKKQCDKALRKAGAERVDIRAQVQAPPKASGKRAIPGVDRLVAVASGKGGVGKSTVSHGLAKALARRGLKVGLLDCDLYGPSVPHLTGLDAKPEVDQAQRIAPLERDGIKIMSMGFLIERGRNLSWRGPMVHKMLQQLLHGVDWGALDYLILDLPPGTGDVQLSLAQSAPLTAGLAVTTPQEVALADARKAVQMFLTMKTPALGFVENMGAYLCRGCGKRHAIFRDRGGHRLAEEFQLPLLAEIPLIVDAQCHGEALDAAFDGLAEKVTAAVDALPVDQTEWAAPGQGAFEV